MRPLSKLNGHPDRNKVPGVEANTGPLGHGLPIAVGTAVAAKLDGAAWRTFVLTGDGELQEGSNWEAAMAAAHYGLDNLTVIVDRNRLQQGDATEQTVRLEPLADRWRAFGWAVDRGGRPRHRGADATSSTACRSSPGGPTCVIARTHKGPRRVVHRGPGRVASPRADRRGAGDGPRWNSEGERVTGPPTAASRSPKRSIALAEQPIRASSRS